MSNNQSTEDILIKLSKRKAEFSIETEQEGKLEFGMFAVWREQILSRNVAEIESMDNKLFAKNVMKFSLYKYKDVIIDYDSYNKDKSIFDNINLNVNEYEIRQFAEKFLENNESMLYEIYSEEISKKDDYNDIDEFKERARNNRKPLFKFPEDILEKLKLAFVFHYNRQSKLTENILGLKMPKNFFYISELIKQQNKMNEILKVKEQINQMQGIKAKTKIVSKNSINEKFNKILEQESNHKAEISASILRLPSLIETMIENIDSQVDNIIQTQKLVSDSRNLRLKASNEILQSQLDLAEENIKSSNLKANIALWLSIGSLIVTILIGGYQIYDSSKTSSKDFEKQDMIIESITNGNKIYKENIDATNKLINELINDNQNLKNRINELEEKFK